MSGAPGSGKSTLANLLARHTPINGVIINHDLIKSFLLDNGNTFQQSAALTYGLQWVLAGDLLNQGRNVIIDSTCNFQETLDQGTKLARQYGYDYVYIECRVSLSDIDILEKRLRDRVALRSQRTSVDTEPIDGNSADPLARYKKWIESPLRPASHAVIAVDSTGSPADCLDHVMKQMGLPVEARCQYCG